MDATEHSVVSLLPLIVVTMLAFLVRSAVLRIPRITVWLVARIPESIMVTLRLAALL